MPGSPFSNINITNNFIADSGRSAIWVGNTAGGAVSGNYIFDANVRPDLANAYASRSADALQPLVIDTTSNGVTTANNTIDKTSGRIWITDTQYRELAAYAPGATIRLNAYNIGSFFNPTITLTDADGNTSPIVVQAKTAHALDVAIPVMVGLGGAYLALTSGNLKYFGTLFLDTQDNIPSVNGCTDETSLPSSPVVSAAVNLPILVVTQTGVSTKPWMWIRSSMQVPALQTSVFLAGSCAVVFFHQPMSVEIAVSRTRAMEPSTCVTFASSVPEWC